MADVSATSPTIARRMMESLLETPEDRETIVGDLEQGFADLVTQRGPRAACWWYWQQVLRSAPWLLRHEWQRAPARRRVAAATVVGIAPLLLLGVLRLGNGVLSRTFATTGPLACVLFAMASVGVAALVAYLLGRAVDRARRFMLAPGAVAATSGILWTLAGAALHVVGRGTAPAWYLVAVAGATWVALWVGATRYRHAD